jgi:hypothetical protein
VTATVVSLFKGKIKSSSYLKENSVSTKEANRLKMFRGVMVFFGGCGERGYEWYYACEVPCVAKICRLYR